MKSCSVHSRPPTGKRKFPARGLAATLTAPSGRYLEFTHEQGLLTRIAQKLSRERQDINQDVLRVFYNAQRRPIRLLAGTLERKSVTPGTSTVPTPQGTDSSQEEMWGWDGLALIQRGNDYYVNEPHLAGGQTLLRAA